MAKYIIRRILLGVVILFMISFIVFFTIQLPPGDFVDTLVTNMIAEGETVTEADVENLKEMYGVNRPFIEQYFDWVSGILQGDWGISYYHKQKVLVIIGETLETTVMLSVVTMIFTWLIGVPIGIYAARHQYSFGDYFFTSIGFIGIALPNFLLAIILMYLSFKWFGKPIMGLFPEGGITSWRSFLEFLSKLIIPLVVIGTDGICGMIRGIRAQLLDELEKPFILCARAKGVSEKKITFKYAMRAIYLLMFCGIGSMLSGIFNGSTITAIVLMLPTLGPVMLKALQTQDVYLSGGVLMISAIITLSGTLISDIFIAIIDPRIKYVEEKAYDSQA